MRSRFKEFITWAIPLVLLAGLAAAAVVLFLPSPPPRPHTGHNTDYWLKDDPAVYRTRIDIPHSPDYIIAVYKAEHRLRLVREGRIVREYGVNVRNELPDRLLWDDEQTPEGVFTVWQLAKVSDPPWTRWLALDTAAKARHIFEKEYADGTEILRAYEARCGALTTDDDIRRFNDRNPDTPMLRGFGIHGGGFRPGRDWTLGCPALNDSDVIELFDMIRKNPDHGVGTLVIIQD